MGKIMFNGVNYSAPSSGGDADLDATKSNVLSGSNGIKVDDKLSGKLWFLICVGGGSQGIYSASAIGVGGTVYNKSDSKLGIIFINGIMQLTRDDFTIGSCKLFY